MNRISLVAAAALCAGCAGTGTMTQPAGPGVVKITPLGSHDGEFCPVDRAMVFEDPDGTRILYDAGFTVRGADDPRLGKIDAVLLSHVHGDHLGPAHQAAANAGTCAKPAFTVKDTPNSNTANIAAGKHAKILAGSDMHTFLAAKVKAAGGDPAQVQLVRFGALVKVGGVSVATVTATHTNGVDPAFLAKPLGDELQAQGLNADVGPPVGYILRFSNGLVAYLSGDTGLTSDQQLVVRGYYHANLVVMNIGGTPFTTGPAESAYVINDLVKPNAVIVSHANEVATQGGKVLPNTKTAAFIKAVGVPAYPSLSGDTMSFDGNAKCVSGC
ncbi:MAG TPA: MBL fold metallo-hydrolase [Burkholderiales bacterium]|nr:MBL fold metallo-hydrolase [Burkholderiales bacterium]